MYNRENVIEWLNGSDMAAFTFNQRRYITKMEKLAKKYPQKVRILERNSDGSIFGHICTRAISISQLALKSDGKSRVLEQENIAGDEDAI